MKEKKSKRMSKQQQEAFRRGRKIGLHEGIEIGRHEVQREIQIAFGVYEELKGFKQ